MVSGAGGLLCPGSPVVLGDIGRLVEDVVTTTDEYKEVIASPNLI